MRRNLLVRKSAPEGTRTPNLLIRSQSVPPRISASTVKTRPVTATETPKAVTGSHNNSHNTRPDIYQDRNIHLVSKWAY